MSEYLHVGMRLYHKTNRTCAAIVELDDKNITIELVKGIAGKKKLILPITHVGEWLFYNENEIDMTIDALVTKPQYLTYGNKILLKSYNSIVEQRRKKEIEEQERLLKTEKEKELLKEKRRQQEKKAKLDHELKDQFIKYLQGKFQFDGFYHYTDFTNFINIMQLGKLLSRNEAQKNGFLDAAEQSVIKRTQERVKDYVRLYYKEKTPTIYSNEGIKVDNASPHMPIPIILLFNEKIIYHNDVAFTSGCGGSVHSQITESIVDAREFNWETIFSRSPIHTDENCIMTSGFDTSKAGIINKRNAEFLYLKELDIKYIKKIVFRCPADLKHAISVLGENKIYEVNPLKFNNHHNFLYDCKIEKRGNSLLIALVFQTDYHKYTHILRITYKDNFLEEIDISVPSKRIINKEKPSEFHDYDYYFEFTPIKNNAIVKVEYLMNGNVSAI